MSIPSHVLDQINAQADLVAIIGRHTTLKKAGREFKGCCPFHGEKTPSFYVNPQKNFYHCFGCGASGNAIGFLKDYENLTFMEAVEELSKQTGIEIPKNEQADVKYQRTFASTSKNNSSNDNQQSPTSIDADITNTSTQSNVAKQNHTQSAATATPTNNSDGYDDIAFKEYGNDNAYDDFEAYYGSGTPISTNVDGMNEVNGINNPTRLSHQQPISHQQPTRSSKQHPKQEGDLYDLLNQINAFYQSCLDKNTAAKQYFLSRGLTAQTLQTFGLGYAPAGWQHLEQQFPNDIQGLKILGLVRQAESGRDYDLLRDRVIFPIKDNQGRVIGFAGRALDDTVKPKYINSSDSPVFHKQHVLYGYYEARQQRANDWLVVEGYMDVIALYQAGIYGAVASMGTAINEAQISRLLTLNPTLTLCFDGDGAGQKAAWRTLELSMPVLSDDKALKFLTLPDGHDPDTFVKTNGVDAMREQIANATPLSQYVFAYLSARHDLSLAEGKAKLMSQVRALTNQLPKGSSFRSLLNNDIYQKLGGRRAPTKAAQDALLNFTSNRLTVNINLYLCLLYQPTILDNKPLSRLWAKSGVAHLTLPENLLDRLQQVGEQVPNLPTFKDLNDPALFTLINTIQKVLPYLPDDTNAASHFILANLEHDLQNMLAEQWQQFYRNMVERSVLDVSFLFEELIVQVLVNALKQQCDHAQHYVIKEILKRRWQTLIAWQKNQEVEEAAKTSSFVESGTDVTTIARKLNMNSRSNHINEQPHQ